MLIHYAIPEYHRQNALSEAVWMQDGAPLRVGSSVKSLLSQQFGAVVTSHHLPFPWPPKSPDLTPMDFWLWGYMKSKVYEFYPQSVSHLKDAVRAAIQEIPIAMVRAAVLFTICRMLSVIVCTGGHIENL